MSLPTRQADHLGGADIAAGDARREAEHRVIDQNIGEHGGDDAEHEAPMDVGAGNEPIMLAAPISRVDGLFRLVGSRIGPSTRWLRIASAM